MAKAVFENEWLQIEKTITDELPIYEELKTREKYDVWLLSVKKCRFAL